jgi:uncharacterized membrane protein YphA (DoxX/SURF4 family)
MSSKKSKAKQQREPVWARLIRIILGLVFIFSSLMKGVDPLGTAYRVEDYLGAYTMEWLSPYALAIAIFLITIEFLLGFALVFKLQAKLAALGVLLIMVFFTLVTYFDARYNLVPDCGCFGDAIKLDNWETFYKNIVLILMAVLVFVTRKSVSMGLPGWLQSTLLILFAGGFLWFIFYNYNHLPILDFRDWKEGRDMKTENEDAALTYLVYKHKDTGELREYTAENLPWRDSVWKAQWEFVDQRFDDSQVLKKHHLIIENAGGTNFTKAVVEKQGYQFLLVSWDLDHANGEGMLTASGLFQNISAPDVGVALLTASGPEVLGKYFQAFDMRYPIFFADGIELKAMIRSNPGLLLLKDGVVLEKWHYNDFPKNWREARFDTLE